ncbi:site-specific DNA-methyltransferase [Salinimicrobium tongyeongense]|uniref:site-specific DNA-methyltransferase (adenine-specific) n=1 Tax=Salinimicrobium tongyeongense TaxID=2809707 RepID=A0ABY6NTV2_9FLAO|nr:site-specific DNA-methyltransferase [Salinimicrobium tongyeongense]UZH56322.1 site-specific DNA-methyltransferase [Salinimicrobium tongyeongense]
MGNEENRSNLTESIPNNIEILKKYFGQCFTKTGTFDIEKFKQEIAENEVDFSVESYTLDWLGKSYAQILATNDPTTLLKEDEAFNNKEGNKDSQNLLIKGDNLEVLKHLSNAYNEAIRLIYIDPPYNTGSDGFVYKDNRKFTVDELKELAGIDEEKAKRILDFTQSNSNSHSAWLTFMYPRLYIARQLLDEDGVIFVSIDDNEVAQLRVLMDTVFGEENFIAQIVHNKLNSKNDTTNVQKNHEYLICYRKETQYISATDIKASLERKKVVTKEVFKEEDKFFEIKDPITTRGDGGTLNKRHNLGYTVYYNPETKDFQGIQDYNIELAKTSNNEEEVYEDNIDLLERGYIKIRPPKVRGKLGAWTWELPKFTKDSAKIIIKKTKNGYTVNKRNFIPSENVESIDGKFYVTYDDTTNSRSILKFSTNDGTTQLADLLGVSGVFSNPKNRNLIKYIISLIPDKDFIVLDFFAGSGTTGDAVMELNANDGGNRKYILVQLPEIIDPKKDKAAYDFAKNKLSVKTPTIFDITKERLIRSAKRIEKENVDKPSSSKKELCEFCGKKHTVEIPESKARDLSEMDLGLKIFETFPVWEDYNLKAEKLEAQTKLFDEKKLVDEDLKALLTTWKTYDGIALTNELEEILLGNYISYFTEKRLYLVNKGFKTINLKALLEEIDTNKKFNPTSIVAFGYHFESKNLREIAENIKTYSNKKNIDIDFIIRY